MHVRCRRNSFRVRWSVNNQRSASCLRNDSQSAVLLPKSPSSIRRVFLRISLPIVPDVRFLDRETDVWRSNLARWNLGRVDDSRDRSRDTAIVLGTNNSQHGGENESSKWASWRGAFRSSKTHCSNGYSNLEYHQCFAQSGHVSSSGNHVRFVSWSACCTIHIPVMVFRSLLELAEASSLTCQGLLFK